MRFYDLLRKVRHYSPHIQNLKKNIVSVSQDYFYITLNADGTDPNTGKLVTKGAWSLNKPMTGWELYAAGYINNAKNTTDVGYPIAKYSYV